MPDTKSWVYRLTIGDFACWELAARHRLNPRARTTALRLPAMVVATVFVGRAI